MSAPTSICSLLYSAYAKSQCVPQHDEFYAGLIPLLELNDIKPQIYHILQVSEILDKTPGFFKENLRKRRNSALFQNLIIKRETERILSSFDESCIESIWLKGTRFAERFYGHCGARSTSDVDILVPTDLLGHASAVLRELGYYGPIHHVPAHFHQEFVKQLPGSSFFIIVEIHHNLVKPGVAHIDLEAIYRNAELIPGYKNIRELSELQSLYFACIHFANHSLQPLKLALDIIHLMCRSGGRINLPKLINQTKIDGTQRLVGIVLSTLYKKYPFLVQFHVLPEDFRVSFNDRWARWTIICRLAIMNDWGIRLKYLKAWLFPRKSQAMELAGINCPKNILLLQIYVILYTQRLKEFWKQTWQTVR